MNRSKVFKAAHQEMKASNFNASWSSCLKTAYALERKRMQKRNGIIKQLKTGLKAFQFKKKDGSTRTAFGTLDTSLFNYIAKGSKASVNVEYVKYWDLEKQAWRMFKLDNFIGFIPLLSEDATIELAIDATTSIFIDAENCKEYIQTSVAIDDFGDSDLIYTEIDNAELSSKDKELADAFITSFYNTRFF